MVSGWDKNPGTDNDYTGDKFSLLELMKSMVLPLLIVVGMVVYHFYG